MTQIVADHDSLWHWCLQVYAREGVPALCLQAQDQHGADVCLLLCALWLEQRGIACTAPRAAQLQALADDWRQRVVLPLRQLRRAWKPAAQQDAALASLRQQLQTLEINAEHELLDRLQAQAAQWPALAGSSSGWLDWLIERLPAELCRQLQQMSG